MRYLNEMSCNDFGVGTCVAEVLEYEYIPETQEEFLLFIESAPTSILEGMGFKPYARINDIIIENQKKLCRFGDPVELNVVDEEILLFPESWGHLIPEGFPITGLFGQDYKFITFLLTEETNFNCLPFGIKRKI